MRTTLTLEPDVAVQIDELRRQRDISLKEAVNLTLRSGLANLTSPATTPPAYHTQPWDGGTCALHDIDDIGEVLALIEGDAHR